MTADILDRLRGNVPGAWPGRDDFGDAATEIERLRAEVDLGKSMYGRAMVVFAEERDKLLFAHPQAAVPREPTVVMYEAAESACDKCAQAGRDASWHDIWVAMYDAWHAEQRSEQGEEQV